MSAHWATPPQCHIGTPAHRHSGRIPHQCNGTVVHHHTGALVQWHTGINPHLQHGNASAGECAGAPVWWSPLHTFHIFHPDYEGGNVTMCCSEIIRRSSAMKNKFPFPYINNCADGEMCWWRDNICISLPSILSGLYIIYFTSRNSTSSVLM